MRQRILSLFIVLALLLSVIPARVYADPGTKLIALTFDDGPCRDTKRLLKALHDRNVKVTFFMLGASAFEYPDIVRLAYEEGHQIANHSNVHPVLTRLSDQQIKDQISYAEDHLNNAIGGATSYLLRPPYGAYNRRVLELAGVPAIIWSVDSNDWRSPGDADSVYGNIMDHAFDGAIVLVHDVHSWSVTAAIRAVDSLKKQGYEFVTVSELFRRRGQLLSAGNAYRRCSPTDTLLPPIAPPSVSMSVNGNTSYINITADPGTRIFYTTDGSVPDPSSREYTRPVPFEGTADVVAVAGYDMNGSRSSLTKISLKAEPKEARPEIGISGSGIVTIKGKGTVLVTTDGSDPLSSQNVYGGAFRVPRGTVVKAAVRAGSERIHNSDTASLCYSDNGNVFADVSPSDWYYRYMDSAFSEGLLSGTGDNLMTPEGTLTRGMIVAVLYRMAGRPDISDHDLNDTAFSDVHAGKYYEAAAIWAKNNGIASGYQDGGFHPNEPISRQQLAVMLYNYDRYLLENGMASDEAVSLDDISLPFVDSASIGNYAVASIKWAVSRGLLSDLKTAVLDPSKPASRAMTAAMLYHFNHE